MQNFLRILRGSMYYCVAYNCIRYYPCTWLKWIMVKILRKRAVTKKRNQALVSRTWLVESHFYLQMTHFVYKTLKDALLVVVVGSRFIWLCWQSVSVATNYARYVAKFCQNLSFGKAKSSLHKYWQWLEILCPWSRNMLVKLQLWLPSVKFNLTIKSVIDVLCIVILA